MDVHEPSFLRTTQDAKDVRYRTVPRRQDRADQQKLSIALRAVDEQWRERQDDPGEAGSQVRHEASLARDTTSLSITPASSPSTFHYWSK